MATVIESLVLEFGLDPTNFSRGQQQVLEDVKKLQDQSTRGMTEVEASTKKVLDLLSTFRREAVGALALFFGGHEMTKFIDNVITLDASTGRLSRTMGISANELGVWQGAVQQVGGTAQSASAALAAMDAELVKLDQTGQSSILGVLSALRIDPYDQNHQLKSSPQVLTDIAAALQRSGMDPRHQAGFLRMLGVNEDMINLLTRGTRALNEMLEASRRAGTTTAQSAAQAAEYQRQLALLEQSASNLGRTLTNILAPALTGIMKIWANTLQNPTGENSLFGLNPNSLIGRLWNHVGKDETIREAIDRSDFTTEGRARSALAEALRARAAGGGGSPIEGDPSSYIAQAAAARGIDPGVALAVFGSEGKGSYVGDDNSSFGPFQLHYGGVSSRFPHAGLGDKFTAKTGLDARDRSTQRQQIDFALDYAKEHGWGSWMGWKGSPNAGIGQGGGTNVNVGAVNVYTNSDNAEGIANAIGPALKRSVKAGMADTGAN